MPFIKEFIIWYNEIIKAKCWTKNFACLVSNRQKYIANLNILPMHFRQDFAKYRIQSVMKIILHSD